MNLSLSPEQFRQAFPFHLVFDRGMALIQAGPVLSRICPELSAGVLLLEHFQIERPVFAQNFDALLEAPNKLFILAHRSRSLKLRGQMMPDPGGSRITFLCSPWMADASSVVSLGLTLDDFALHDSVPDFLHAMQSQTQALSELRTVASQLEAGKKTLAATNQQLEEALAVLNATLEATEEGILVADLNRTMISFNRRFLEMWRIPEDLASTRDSNAIRQLQLDQLADPAAFMDRLAALYGDPQKEGRDRIELRDGRRFERDSKPQLLRGKIIGRVWCYRDVTADWQARQALRLSEERYRSVAQTASDGILTVGEDGRILFANNAAGVIFQRHPEQLKGFPLTRLMPGAHSFRKSSAIQTDGYRPDGSRVPLELSLGAAELDGEPWYTAILRDVTEWRRTLQALGDSESRYRLLVDNLQEAVFQTDVSGRWTFLNPAWTTISGYSIEESLGRPFLEFVHPDDRAANMEQFVPLLERKKPYCRHTIRYVRKDGGIRHIEVHARLVLGDASAILGTAGLLTDVSARLDFEAGLERAKEAAEAANLAKTQFLANVSHEIRTPLNAIIGMTELLGQTHLSPEQLDCQQTVLTSAESLLHLINELLDISKIEAGQMDIEQAEFDPGEICESVAAMFKPRLQNREVQLFCWAEPALAPRVLGDANRTRQILINLLANALKFTRQGHVSLSLSWQILQGEQVRLVFRVADTGIGIATQDLHRVFEKFVQLDPSNSRTFSGTGLGLHISRALAEAMNGSLTVQSEPGNGSTFQLELVLPRSGTRTAAEFQLLQRCRELPAFLVWSGPGPMREVFAAWSLQLTTCETTSEAKALLATTTGQQAPVVFQFLAPESTDPPSFVTLDLPLLPSKLEETLRKLLGVMQEPALVPQVGLPQPHSRTKSVSPVILIIEDNPENQKLAARHLSSAGYRYEIAADGMAGVELASRFVYDVILMDLRMPGMDGFETAARIRANESASGNARVPIVAVTAHALEEHRGLAFQRGMDDYLTKPYHRDDLLQTVATWIDPRPLVLVVDDAPEIIHLMQGYLKKQCRIVAASDKAQAVAEFARRNVSLVLMDLQVGMEDGLEIARTLLKMPRSVPVPIVAMTGDTGRSVRERCLAAGLSGYLAKPVRRQTLLETVERFCSLTATPAPLLISIDPELADLIPEYIRSVRERTAEMASLAASGDLAGVQRLAHQIKGSGGGYGFPQITELGRDILQAAKARDQATTARVVALLESYLATLQWEIAT